MEKPKYTPDSPEDGLIQFAERLVTRNDVENKAAGPSVNCMTALVRWIGTTFIVEKAFSTRVHPSIHYSVQSSNINDGRRSGDCAEIPRVAPRDPWWFMHSEIGHDCFSNGKHCKRNEGPLGTFGRRWASRSTVSASKEMGLCGGPSSVLRSNCPK